MSSFFFHGSRNQLLIRASVMVAIVAFIDWRVDLNVSFGFLYLFPMLILGSCLRRWQIATAAGLCTLLAELFDPFAWEPTAGTPRDIFMFAAFLGLASLPTSRPGTVSSPRNTWRRSSRKSSYAAKPNSS